MLNRSDVLAPRRELAMKGRLPGQAPLCQPRLAPQARRPAGGTDLPVRDRRRLATRCPRVAAPRRRYVAGRRRCASPPARGPPCPSVVCGPLAHRQAGPMPIIGPALTIAKCWQGIVVQRFYQPPGHSSPGERRPDGPYPVAVPAPRHRCSRVCSPKEPAPRYPYRMSTSCPQGTDMLAAHIVHVTSGTIIAIRALGVVLAISGVIFWRAALKIILTVAAILIASGAIAFLQGVLHVIK